MTSPSALPPRRSRSRSPARDLLKPQPQPHARGFNFKRASRRGEKNLPARSSYSDHPEEDTAPKGNNDRMHYRDRDDSYGRFRTRDGAARDSPGDKESRSATGPVVASRDGTYKGVANYSNFIQKNPDAPDRKVGPVKRPTNVRTITVTDFAPDVCKDYKQTGFCGFGDSCKFLHAREDYKQGWALDRDWEIQTKGKRVQGRTVASANRGAKERDDDDEDGEENKLLEKIPFACIVCKQPYKNPIIARCGHYFCESCALQRYRKNPSCAACGAGTNGVFNGAKNLKKLLEKKKARAERVKAKLREEGVQVSDGEGEGVTGAG